MVVRYARLDGCSRRLLFSGCQARQRHDNYGSQASLKARWLGIDRRDSPTNGQVLYTSHPHLLKPAELMPGLRAEAFGARRSALLDLIEGQAEASHSRHVALLVGSRLKYATGPVFYRFQPSPSVLYYTGFDLPDSIVLWSRDDYVLFMDPSCHPAFEGSSIEPLLAQEIFGFSKVLPLDQLGPYLAESGRMSRTWLDMCSSNASLIASPALLEALRSRPCLAPLIESMRVNKSLPEVELIRQTCRATVPAFIAAMKATRAGMQESHLAHILRYHMCVPSAFPSQQAGLTGAMAEDLAYEPVVASGSNALVLHYTRNAHLLAPNQLVLVDAGALCHGYRSDVSRTWPVNGRFSEAQRALYGLVLATHHACADWVKVTGERGSKRPSLHSLYTLSLQLLYEGLKKLGFGGLSVADVASVYYPHDVGHYLGLDLHDTPSVSKTRPLEPGNVITIEPGLYIPHAHPNPKIDIPPAFQGLGIRLEDDFLVTAHGVENLTCEIPIEIEAVEDLLMRSRAA